MVAELFGKVVIVTNIRRIPKCCNQCPFYDTMGGMSGYRNSGACIVQKYKSTADIQVSKMRLDSCPLQLVKRKRRNQLKINKAIAWLNWMRDYSILRHSVNREAVNMAIEALKDQQEENK